MKSIKTTRIVNLVYISIFTAILAVCSWISIPAAIPFTMQTFALFLSINILGSKRTLAVLAVYMLLGIVGCPVFSGFRGGAAVLFDATGGYILGFFVMVMITGGLLKLLPNSLIARVTAMLAGLVGCYIFGTVWFAVLYSNSEGYGMKTAITLCVLPYIVPDIIKLCAAHYIGNRVQKAIKRIQ